MEKFTRGFTVFFLGVDLGISYLLGCYFSYQFWRADPLSAIFKIFAIFIGLMIITRFIITISARIYWPNRHEVHIPPYDLRRTRLKLTNSQIAQMMQEKYKGPL